MEPLISKTPVPPLPRPLEQEQWHIETDINAAHLGWLKNGRGEKCSHQQDVFSLRPVRDAHNTSLRALQEELEAAEERYSRTRSELSGVYNKLSAALATCKAKDEALRDIIAVDNQGWSESHKAAVMRDRVKRALALQPDSSVKLEQKYCET